MPRLNYLVFLTDSGFNCFHAQISGAEKPKTIAKVKRMRGGSIVITTKPITTERMTIKGTLPRKSTSLKLGYLKLETINRPETAVISAPIIARLGDISMW